MTPEQRAMLPAHPVPGAAQAQAEAQANLERVNRCLAMIREIHQIRRDMEYPPGHPERPKAPR